MTGVQTCALPISPDGTRTSWWSLINPGIAIPADATATHGITDDAVLQAPRFEVVAPKLIRAFQDCDVAGYNVARYDNEVLANEFRRVGVCVDGPAPFVIDGLRLWQLIEPRTLADFVRRFAKRELGGAHRAEADVLGTIDGLLGLLEEAGDRLPSTVPELHALQFPVDPNAVDKHGKFVRDAEGRTCFSFGKHAGVPLSAVPLSYTDWWLREGRGVTFEHRALVQDVMKGIRR